MRDKLFHKVLKKTWEEKKRLVIPLVGFPGINLTGSTIKLAQQNYCEHFKVLKAIAGTFKPDAVFPLMDLSVEANALGRYTVFPKEESATVVKDDFHVDEINSAEKVNIACDTRLLGYIETMKMMHVGFPSSTMRGAYVTGPYTFAALLMGADEAALATVLNPGDLHKLCLFTTLKIQEYVRLLIVSGAQIICILEPSAVMLGPEQFEKFSGRYVSRICDSCNTANVATVYHVCGNSMHLVEKMAEAGVDGLSLDSHEAGIDLIQVANRIPPEVAIIGNISPIGSILKGQSKDVTNDVNFLLKTMDEFPNFILSTGCDLPQETPIENIIAFMNTGRDYRIN